MLYLFFEWFATPNIRQSISIEKQLNCIFYLLPVSELKKRWSLPLNQFDPHRFVNVQEVGCTKESTSLGSEYFTFWLFNYACPSRHLHTPIMKRVVARLRIQFNIISIKLGTKAAGQWIFRYDSITTPRCIYIWSKNLIICS